ncbi:hypothetical protein Tco_1351792 [Tanacetum coccineum]
MLSQHFRQKPVNTLLVRNTLVLSDIEDSHGPSDAMHNPSQPLKVRKYFVSKLTEIHSISIDFLTPRNIGGLLWVFINEDGKILLDANINKSCITKPKATKQSKPLASKAAPVTKPAVAKAPKPTASQPPKPTPATTEPSKKDQSKKRKLVKESSEAPSPAKRPKAGKVIKKRKPKSSLQLIDEFVDEGVPDKEPVYGDEEADTQRAIEESLKEVHDAHRGPLPPVVIREPDSGKFQPLPDVQGKGKEKVSDEQVALDLLTLQTPKKKSPAEQYIFQRRSSAPTEPSGHDESSSLYAELGLTDSETESDEEVPGIDAGDQDEGQAGPNPGIQDEGQAGSNPGDAAVSQPQSSHAGPNREHMDFEVTDASIQQNPEQMDEEFTTTAYPNVQENLKLPTEDQVRLEEPASSAGTLSSLLNLDKELSFADQFLVEKSQEDEPEKTNTELEVQSMVTVHIHQDTSSVPLMTTPVIDLTVSQPVSTTVQAPLPTSTATVTAITTTTSLPPPPPQPQQSTTDSILIKRIGLTFELMKGTCKSLTELEYFCEEVYKATTKRLDWINPEGRQYPHDLRQPLPLVPNAQGRHVIPFHHFINNDLEYLRGGESSRKYSTSVTKTTAADYGHIKWIEDLVPNSMWSQMIIKYEKFALWGISVRIRRSNQYIGNMSAYFSYSGKVTNLNVEERIAFNVSLRMFTRSVVIQRRVEDLQLGVESYQKKLNLTKPDTYRSNLRRRDAYTPYSDPRGFMYENKDKKNRLMRIDELHKFSDGTLDDVQTA